MPKPEEVAVLIVNGKEYRDWLTVSVSHRWADGNAVFAFTCSEALPLVKNVGLLGIKPGDLCTITLAGHLAITGEVTTRQVVADARSHRVQIIGKSLTWNATRSSLPPDKSNFDGNSWEQIARSALGELGINLKVIGSLDATPFKYVQAEPGEIVFQFLERLARHRGIVVGSDQFGNMLGIGDHSAAIVDALVEGGNILREQCVITNEYIYRRYLATAQSNGSDQLWGRAASEITASTGGSYPRGAQLVTPNEMPGDPGDAQRRAQFEARWHEGTQVVADIVVQGWLNRTGDLWRVGSLVDVDAPMLMLHDPLKIKDATFEQSSDAGTTTTLRLVLPWFLNDLLNFSAANLPSAPDPARQIPPPN
jgi:prophage tail gpP-like protein